MNIKTLLAILSMASVAMCALPATGSAQEIHLEGVNSFTGTGGPSSFTATGEPTITCESTDINNGTVSTGGTTGSLTLDLTGCHATVFGLTVQCHTSGSPNSNTIAWSATFHLITVLFEKPAMLVTPAALEIVCAGISNTRIEGNGLIGTITSPRCKEESFGFSVWFTVTGSQNHKEYTGSQYDLKAKTSGGSQLTAALSDLWHLESIFTRGVLSCT